MVVISRSMRCSLVLTTLMLLAASPLISTEDIRDEISIIGGGILSVSGLGALSETTITESIVIDGDAEYRAFIVENGLPGEGTETDPIVWEDLNFKIGDEISGIEFNGTSLHTLIINCTFTMATSANRNTYLSGVIIEGSMHIAIRSSTFTNIHYPAYFESSSDCEISNCKLDGGVRYVQSQNSQRISVQDNHFIYGGIVMVRSNWCTISNNVLSSPSDDIYIFMCDNCTLDGNEGEWSDRYNLVIMWSMDITLKDNRNNGLIMIYGEIEHFETLRLIGRNTALGKDVLFFEDRDFNGTWNATEEQVVIFLNCSNLKINKSLEVDGDIGLVMTLAGCSNVTLDDWELGVELYEHLNIQGSRNVKIRGMDQTMHSSIDIDQCEDIEIRDSEFFGGPMIERTAGCRIINNTFSGGYVNIKDSYDLEFRDNQQLMTDLDLSGDVENISIVSNDLQHGSRITTEPGCRDIQLRSNVLDNTSIFSISGPISNLRTFQVDNNTVSGNPFVFLIDGSYGGREWEGDAGQIFAAGVSDLVFRDQVISSQSDLMTLLECDNIQIIDTEFTSDPDLYGYDVGQPYGLRVKNCSNIVMTNILMNVSKMRIDGSDYVQIDGGRFESADIYSGAIKIGGSRDCTVSNSIFDSWEAMEIDSSQDILISGNHISGRDGISIRESAGSILSNNSLDGFGTGVLIEDCSGSLIEGNQFDDMVRSIYISTSRDDIIRSNHFIGGRNKVEIRRWAKGTFSNNLVNSDGFRGILIIDSHQIMIDDNEIINDDILTEMEGITLIRSNWCIISNCSFPELTSMAVKLDRSNDTVIRNNTFFRNTIGISLSYSNNNSISGNTFQLCSEYAVLINIALTHLGPRMSANNTIWNNTFLRNSGSGEIYNSKYPQALDSGSNNTWYHLDGYGNTWSDWRSPNYDGNSIVDEPYLIGGDAGALDIYPYTDVVDVKFDPMANRDRSNLGFYFVPVHILIIFLAVYFLVIGARPYKMPKDEIKGKTKSKDEKKMKKAGSKKTNSKK